MWKIRKNAVIQTKTKLVKHKTIKIKFANQTTLNFFYIYSFFNKKVIKVEENENKRKKSTCEGGPADV